MSNHTSPSDGMDPEMLHLIEGWSRKVTLSEFSGIILEPFTCGLELFMVVQGYQAYVVSTKEQRTIRRPYIIISFVLFFLALIYTSADCYEVTRTLLRPGSLVDYVYFQSEATPPWWSLMGAIAALLVLLIGDAVLLYRCHLLWHRIWILAFIGLVYIASIVAGSLWITIQMIGVETSVGQKYLIPAEFSWFFLSASTSLLLAGFISFRLIRAKRRITDLFPEHDTTVYTRAAMIVIESAAPFALLGFAIALVTIWHTKDVNASIGLVAINYVWGMAGALAPQLIIYRINTGQSFVRSPSDQEDSMKLSRSLAFAHTQPQAGPEIVDFNSANSANVASGVVAESYKPETLASSTDSGTVL